jgi:hypothetical protein
MRNLGYNGPCPTPVPRSEMEEMRRRMVYNVRHRFAIDSRFLTGSGFDIIRLRANPG